MAGVMWWALSYDATNKMSLARVAQHYAMFKRGVPDLNLDGKVNAADANTLANNMGTVPGWTGTNTHGAVRRLLHQRQLGERRPRRQRLREPAGRRLAGRAVSPRWASRSRTDCRTPAHSRAFTTPRAFRPLAGAAQSARAVAGDRQFHAARRRLLVFRRQRPRREKHSNSAVTLRNQNAAEAFDALNTAPRMMRVELAEPIELAAKRRHLCHVPGAAEHGAAARRAGCVAQSHAGAGVSRCRRAEPVRLRLSRPAATIRDPQPGRRRRRGCGGRRVRSRRDLFVRGQDQPATAAARTRSKRRCSRTTAIVGRFIDPGFAWMLTANGSAGFDPLITQLQFTSLFEANYTVSNVWIGAATTSSPRCRRYRRLQRRWHGRCRRLHRVAQDGRLAGRL